MVLHLFLFNLKLVNLLTYYILFYGVLQLFSKKKKSKLKKSIVSEDNFNSQSLTIKLNPKTYNNLIKSKIWPISNNLKYG